MSRNNLELPPNFKPQTSVKENGKKNVPDDLISEEIITRKLIKDKKDLEKLREEMGLDPKKLLLTPEDADKIPFNDRYSYIAGNDDQQIYIMGTRHTIQYSDVQDFGKLLEEYNPDLVLTEIPDPLEKYFDNNSEEIKRMSPEKVIEKQEQIFFTWLAKKKGRDVLSWDIPLDEVINKTLSIADEKGQKKYSEEDAIVWLTTYGLEQFYRKDDDGNVKINKIKTTEELYEHLYDLIMFAYGENKNTRLDLSKDNINRVIKKITGQTLDDFFINSSDETRRNHDQGLLIETSDQKQNNFARDKNSLRDQLAIEKIQKAKDAGKKRILVTAGGSHAIVWQKAIEEIYK